MINEIIEFIRTKCKEVGISKAYQDINAGGLDENTCSVTAIADGIDSTNLKGNQQFITQQFAVLYKGNKSRSNSNNLIELAYKNVNNTFNEILANTNIVQIRAQAPKYAFTDERGNLHYNFTMQIIYHERG